MINEIVEAAKPVLEEASQNPEQMSKYSEYVANIIFFSVPVFAGGVFKFAKYYHAKVSRDHLLKHGEYLVQPYNKMSGPAPEYPNPR